MLQELDAFCSDVVLRDASLNGIVRTEGRKLQRAMRDVETDEALHDARIKAKRVRYAAEVAEDKDVVARAKRFQDVVGEHQDAVFAEERLRSLSEPATALVIGRLIERQRARRAAAARRRSEGLAKARQVARVIRAAGGIIIRDGEILIVHRPKYDDWSLPKGKCKPGESDEACALREIEEETGLHCEIERALGESHYQALAGTQGREVVRDATARRRVRAGRRGRRDRLGADLRRG